MKHWTFKTQLLAGTALIVSGCVCGTVLHRSLPANIACALYGLLFVVHPVYPKMWNYMEPRKLALSIRIAGGAVMLVSLFLRFDFSAYI